jgi:hypothetical protein
MQILRIPSSSYYDKDGKFILMPSLDKHNGTLEILLTKDCDCAWDKRLTCRKCYGNGYTYTEAGQDVVDFMEPIIEKMIDEKIANYQEYERERRNRC